MVLQFIAINILLLLFTVTNCHLVNQIQLLCLLFWAVIWIVLD